MRVQPLLSPSSIVSVICLSLDVVFGLCDVIVLSVSFQSKTLSLGPGVLGTNLFLFLDTLLAVGVVREIGVFQLKHKHEVSAN